MKEKDRKQKKKDKKQNQGWFSRLLQRIGKETEKERRKGNFCPT